MKSVFHRRGGLTGFQTRPTLSTPGYSTSGGSTSPQPPGLPQREGLPSNTRKNTER